MRKQIFILCCSFLLLTVSSRAQPTLLLHGIVKDSTGRPLSDVTVSIVNQLGTGLSFCKTDEKGTFQCAWPATDQQLSIKVTALGYEPYLSLLRSDQSGNLNIVLRASAVKLKEVNIQSQRKISMSSDTLNYHVKAFRENNDRVIADVINRLPGIRVEENGAISYNGKRITNVYIDGDNLLDNKYKIATNNVPADAVEQIQVIDRDQPIKALNGYVNSNNISLNIKLTDSARIMTVNTAHVGAGNKAYTGALNNLIFKKNVKGINYLKANNLGENLQTDQEGTGVSFDQDIVLKDPQTYLSVDGGSLPDINERYYLMNHDLAGSINTLFKLKSDWSVRLNLSSLQLQRKYRYSNLVSYFLGDADTIRFSEQANQIFKLNQWHAEAQLEKNSSSIYLKSITKVNLPKWKRQGTTLRNTLPLTQYLPSDELSISNETSFVKALGIEHVLQYHSVVQYFKTNEQLEVTPGLHQEIVNNGRNYQALKQFVAAQNLYINQMATFKMKVNQLVLSAALGAEYEQNQLQSNLFKTDSLNQILSVGERFTNATNFDQLAIYGKISALYPLKKGMVSLEAGPALCLIDYDNPKPNGRFKHNFIVWNPIADFRQQLGRYSEISLRYTGQTDFGRINDIYQNNILVNYAQFNANDTPLPRTDFHSIHTRYMYKKPISLLFMHAGFDYIHTRQNFIQSYVVDSGLTRSVAIDFRNKTQQYNLNGNVSKYLFPLSLNFSVRTDLGLQKGNSLYNGEITPFHAYQLGIGVTLRKKIRPGMSINLSADLNRAIYKQRSIAQQDLTNATRQERLKMGWIHELSGKFMYSIQYQYNGYTQSLQNRIHNQFLDVSLKYTPKSRKSFLELQCINAIGQSLYSQITSTPNQLSVYEMPLRSRTILLKYTFTF